MFKVTRRPKKFRQLENARPGALSLADKNKRLIELVRPLALRESAFTTAKGLRSRASVSSSSFTMHHVAKRKVRPGNSGIQRSFADNSFSGPSMINLSEKQVPGKMSGLIYTRSDTLGDTKAKFLVVRRFVPIQERTLHVYRGLRSSGIVDVRSLSFSLSRLDECLPIDDLVSSNPRSLPRCENTPTELELESRI